MGTLLTGELLVPSPQSRTKDSADPAGPSPPLVPLKVLTKSLPERFFLSLSSKLLIAPTLSTDTQASDAMVETSLLPSNILSLIRLNWNPSTNTLQRTEPASITNPPPPLLMSLLTPRSLLTMLSR